MTEGNPFSPWYPYIGRGCPIRLSLVGILAQDAQRFSGEIEDMVAVYPGGKSSAMKITATGSLGVAAQNNDQLRSPMYRSMIGVAEGDYVPHAFWPLEDGPDATHLANAVPGQPGQPKIFVGTEEIRLASDDSMPGSAPLPTLPGDTYIEMTVPAYADTGQWVAQIAMKLTDTDADAGLIIYAGELVIQAQYGHGNLSVAAAPALDPGALIFTNSDGVAADDVLEVWCSLSVSSVSRSSPTKSASSLSRRSSPPKTSFN
jgi:hypothetical protein